MSGKPQQAVALLDKVEDLDLAPMATDVAVLHQILELSRDPKFNPETLKVLYELHKDEQRHQAKKAFNAAMIACQSELSKKPIPKLDKTDKESIKYAKLERIDAIARPIIEKHGFALTWNSRANEGRDEVTVTCECLHVAGHSEHYEMTGGLDTVGDKGTVNKTRIKGAGSSVSFLKRYLTTMIFNLRLVNEDTNNAGEQFINEQEEMQILTLLDHLKELCGSDKYRVKFLNDVMKVPTVADIKARDLGKALSTLKQTVDLEEKRQRG